MSKIQPKFNLERLKEKLKTLLNPIFYIDFYKVGHFAQYQKGITQIFANWTPRYSLMPGVDRVVNFGLTLFLKKVLLHDFQVHFFDRPWADIEAEYKRFIKNTLFVSDPEARHIKALHDLGYLPLKFYSTPEGTPVPLNTPCIVITNTHPDFFWLPNYIETMLSNTLWRASTSATIARQYRALFLKHARRSGETDFGFVEWMGHDFSYRGMGGLDDAIASGMGHLLQFCGTDTAPAIHAAEAYYNADIEKELVGGSVPATEHSVMSAGSQTGELATFRRLLFEVYPAGVCSVVSDTWDLWQVLTQYVPSMRSMLDVRDGKLVIRPDSGDPVKIVCGDPEAAHGNPAADGVLRLLRQALGSFERPGTLPLLGKPHAAFLNTAACIYGDSITLQRADAILTRIIDELKLSPYNMVFGIGSYTYAYQTRDTFGFAMKATAYKDTDGNIVPMWKRPVTDTGGKFSHCGIPAVYSTWSKTIPDYVTSQDKPEQALDNCAYDKVFADGDLLIDPTFSELRNRARVGL